MTQKEQVTSRYQRLKRSHPMIRSLKYYFSLQKKYLKPYPWRVVVVATFFLVGIGTALAGPQVIRHFIDTAQGQGEFSRLYVAALLFLAVGVADRLISILTTYFATDLAWRTTNQLRSDLLVHLLRLPTVFHSSHTPGELVERIDGDIGTLGNFFSRFGLSVLQSGFVLVGVLVLLFIEDWRVALTLIGFGSVFIAVSAVGQKMVVPFWRAERQASAEFSGFIGESLADVHELRTVGGTPYMIRRFHETLRKWFRSELMANVTSRFAVGANFIIASAAFAGALGTGAYLFQRGEITIGTVYLIIHYLALVIGPLWDVSNQIEDLQRSTASVQRVRELLETKVGIRDGQGDTIPKGAVAVEFDKVSFAYRPEVEVLRDVSFRLEPGETLGLLGRSGSGKSTISRVLFRLFDADAGRVLVGGVDVRDARLAELRGRIGLVTQEVQLFQASVRDNLTLFDRSSADDQRILEVVNELELGSWLSSLPNGLDSELPPGGGDLSAGESQLLAFGRVFLRQPDVVILDEAWSRLDPITEGLIEDSVLKLLKNRTAIVIAHRLATLDLVDKVMIVEAGEIQEYGDREVLASDKGSRYSRLLQTGLDEVLA